MATMKWKPSWWKEDMHGNAWDRVKEAMARDWEQTKKDFHLKSGHYLNQDLKDTVKQMTGKEAIPPRDRPNPAKVVGDWNDVELPVGYGYAARKEFGGDRWTDDIESKLKGDWEKAKDKTGRGWNDVRDYVRHGFEYHSRDSRTSMH